MSQKSIITIGNAEQYHDTPSFEISQFCTTGGEIIGSISVNKEETEEELEKELNKLISQEEECLTGNNINRIHEILNKLPIEEKRLEMTYRKDEILKSLKVKNEIQEIVSKNYDDIIKKVEDIFTLIYKYMEINKINKLNDLTQIENNLIKLHNDKFKELLNRENYSLKSIDDNIEKYEELKNCVEKLQENIKFISNGALKDSISEEIDAFSNKKNEIGSKILKLLNCNESSLDQSIKSQKLIKTINNSDSAKQIDIALIESNFIDYINLGQKNRRKALSLFIENNDEKYISILEVTNDLEVVVRKILNQGDYSEIIQF